MLFIIVCLLFSSPRSLLTVSYIFSILLPRFWIIFTIITLNSFSGILPISSSFVWTGGFLPCSFNCCVSLSSHFAYLTVFGVSFHRLQVHSSRCFWCLTPMAKIGSVGCVGFLVEGTSTRVLVMSLDLLFLVGRSVSGGVFWGVCDLIMILGSLSANG